MVRFVGDPIISLTLCAAVILGGLGFPVVFELAREWRRPSQWSVLTLITLATTAALLVVGTFVLTVAEWRNPHAGPAVDTGQVRRRASSPR